MTQYIDKSALVAEIERRIDLLRTNESGVFHTFASEMIIIEYENMLSFLDTLEEKDVDLDDSATHYLLHKHTSPLSAIMHQADLKAEMQYHKDIKDAYKAGFELGLKTKEK